MSVYINDRFDFVREAVESILQQSFSQFHFYIVFDGPVRQDVDHFITSQNDVRLRISRLQKNEGLAPALNHLLKIILKDQNYRIIARMDADDISAPERFERQYKYLSDNPGIGCVGSWYEEIDVRGNHLRFRMLPQYHEELKRRYLTRTPFAHPAVFYRRSLIEKAGLYPDDTTLMEDNVLWGRALKEGIRFANIPEYLLRFRIDERFYNRRSGIKYGLNYIKTRFRILDELEYPTGAYLVSMAVGLIKMMPASILKIVRFF